MILRDLPNSTRLAVIDRMRRYGSIVNIALAGRSMTMLPKLALVGFSAIAILLACSISNPSTVAFVGAIAEPHAKD
jgi:hypothetical protein